MYIFQKKIWKYCFSALIALLIFQPCYGSNHGLDGYQQNIVVDAVKNARVHAGLGNIYFDEGNYAAALDEYNIAYQLTKETNSYAPYLYNIANCAIKINDYSLALQAVREAIKKDCMNITYYKMLVECYSKIGILQKELNRCLKDNFNPYNRIVAGLIYVKLNQKTNAKIIFDEFINQNPDMLITYDVKELLKELQ